jgi:hypothetical protein
MISEDGHRSVARIAIEDCKFERVHEIGIALRVITQLAQFAFRHRDKTSSRNSRAARRVASLSQLATLRTQYSYFGEAAAAGAAIAGEDAPIGAAGASLPLWACIDDLVEALAAAFACRLQR